MTRRRAAAVVVIALVVAVGVWRLAPDSPETSMSVAASSPTVDASPAAPIAADATPTPAPTRAQTLRPRRPATPEAPAQPMTTLFRGRAVFEDGRPAVGAKVRVFAAQVESPDASGRIGSESVVDEDGRFEIVGPEQETGQCVYYGVLPGFAYAAVITTDKDATLTFVRGGTVTGTVFDAEGKPWSDVAVRLVRCDRVGRVGKPSGGAVWKRPDVAAFYTQSTRTDAAGRFRIGGAPLVAPSDKHSVAVVEGPDDADWRSEVATFETSGGELVRDVRVGVHALDGQDPLSRIEGRVTDADGRVIEDADVVYGVLDGGTADERKTDKTDNAGRFIVDLGSQFESNGRRPEVRIAAVGYWNWRGAPSKPDEILRVRLTHWDREPNPGRVLGFATDSNDHALSGALVIDLEDEFFRPRRESVVADERGAFTIDGLWQGAWRLSLDSGQRVDVVIRDGDEVRVRLRAKHDASLFAVKPWTEERQSAWLELQARFRETWSRAEELKKTDASAAETVMREGEKAFLLFHELDEAKRAALPRRDVVVVGIPRDGAYVVRAVCNGVVHSAAANDGAARLASLPIDTWKFSVERFGVGTRPHDVVILPGDGAQTVEFELPK